MSNIKQVRAKIQKLTAQKRNGSPFGDVSKELANARAELAKLLAQKQSGAKF